MSEESITHPGAVQSDEQQLAWRETIASVWRVFQTASRAGACFNYVDQAHKWAEAETNFTSAMVKREKTPCYDKKALNETMGRFRALDEIRRAIQHATTAEECRNIVAVIGNRGPR